MQTTLLSAGLACIIAAIIGGGSKAFSIEIPLINSLRRQVLLGALGLILIITASFVSSEPAPGAASTSAAPVEHSESPVPGLSVSARASLADQQQSNERLVEELQDKLTAQDKNIADLQNFISQQEQNIAAQEVRLGQGEGTPDERVQAQDAIDEAKTAIEKARNAIAEATTAGNKARENIGLLKQKNLEIIRRLSQ
jgi:TolA-binding protein